MRLQHPLDDGVLDIQRDVFLRNGKAEIPRGGGWRRKHEIETGQRRVEHRVDAAARKFGDRHFAAGVPEFAIHDVCIVARAADEYVRAAADDRAARERVVAHLALQQVVAPAAIEEIIPVAALQRVVVVPARQVVIPLAAEQRIRSGTAAEVVIAVAAAELLGHVGADDHVVEGAQDEAGDAVEIVDAAAEAGGDTELDVLDEAEIHRLPRGHAQIDEDKARRGAVVDDVPADLPVPEPVYGLEQVVAGAEVAAEHELRIGGADQGVVAVPAEQVGAVAAADQQVVAGAALDLAAARDGAAQRVAAGATIDVADPGGNPLLDDIGAAITEDDDVAVGSDQRVGAVGAVVDRGEDVAAAREAELAAHREIGGRRHRVPSGSFARDRRGPPRRMGDVSGE